MLVAVRQGVVGAWVFVLILHGVCQKVRGLTLRVQGLRVTTLRISKVNVRRGTLRLDAKLLGVQKVDRRASVRRLG